MIRSFDFTADCKVSSCQAEDLVEYDDTVIVAFHKCYQVEDIMNIMIPYSRISMISVNKLRIHESSRHAP